MDDPLGTINKYPRFETLYEYEVATDSRMRIINAAIYLFSINGFTKTSTKAIAQLAEVSEALIFKQFVNKTGLLEHVFKEIMHIRLPAILAYGMDDFSKLKPSTFNGESFSDFFHTKFNYIAGRIGYIKIVFQELEHNEASAIAGIRVMIAHLFEQIEAVVSHLQEIGFLRGDLPPRTLFRSLAGMMNLLYLDRYLIGTPILLDKEVDSVISLFLKGAQHGIGNNH